MPKDQLQGIQSEYDVIVIGSGLAGLTCANILGRMGRRVLVLEHHYQLGGMATWFRRKRGHIFDISLHGFPFGMVKSCKRYWSDDIASRIEPIRGIRFDNPQFSFETTYDRKDFTRMALGMFAASPAVFPLEFAYAGEAESPDGKADVLDVKGEGDFAARLFVDQKTRLPLMLSWMDKEPISIQMGPGGMTAGPGSGGGMALPGGGTFVQRTEGGGPPPSREEMEKRMKDFEEKRKELEAARRTVEYRVYYADYQAVGGVTLPHRIQRSIDGKPTEEMIFDSMKVNPKIDAKKFQVSK